MRKIRINVSKKIQEREDMFSAAVDALTGGAFDSVVVPWPMAKGVIRAALSLSPFENMGEVRIKTPTYGICNQTYKSGRVTIKKRTLSYGGVNTMGSGMVSAGLVSMPDGGLVGF